MFGLGGLLNRWGWDEYDGWFDEAVGDLLVEHHEMDGCPAPSADWFDEYPDDYYCSYCGGAAVSAVPEREATAYHEAGHGVVDLLTGQRFRYITLRPKGGHVGHVMPATPSRWGAWLDEAAALFAGVIAEDVYWHETHTWWQGDDERDQLRGILVRESGYTDMRYARHVVCLAWKRQRANPRYSLTPVDPAWSVQDMAVVAWQHAVRMVLRNGFAVEAIAERLLESSRALTWTQCRSIVAEVARDGPAGLDVPIPDDLLHPWFLDYSRLRWDQRGSTRPVFMAAAAKGSVASKPISTKKEW